MKKLVSLIMACVLSLASLAGCSTADEPGEDTNERLKIVTTIFPIYDWVTQIVGKDNNDTEVKLLLKNGVDLHSYQPTTEDLVDISDADVFIYVGGHSDAWVEEALDNATNENMEVINLFDVLGDMVKPMTLTEDTTEHDHEDEDGHDHAGLADEHVWVSVKRAEKAVDYITERLAAVDSKNAELYTKNGEDYEGKLDQLDGEYQEAVDSAALDTVVFADRFPFFYLTDDYGLKCYAAFSGCSAESEASFETVAFLAQKIDEKGIKNVLTIENRNHKIPETVIENTKDQDQKILLMNSMQSVTNKDIEGGMTYLDVMKTNLDVLKTALN